MISEAPSTWLTTKNLSVGYGSNVLFENIDLELPTRNLTCFMGPNGIGKSTLIRTIAGLQKPLKGEISKLDEQKIALVLTEKISATHMTVYDLVSYGRYPHVDWNISFTEEDHNIINESLDEIHISSLKDKKLEELSDGQLQLAMIARALAQQTPIILLDEPTAHLDLNNRVEIMKLLLRLAHQKNKTILVATHELDLALQMADHIWLATPDKNIITGIPEDLVLDGSFDEIFRFKGFDLKTGKVQHLPHRDRKINLTGEGPEYLWTKNALEREGFSISQDGLPVALVKQNNSCQWALNQKVFSSLKELVDELKK